MFCLENIWKRNRNDFLSELENIFQIISNFGKPIKSTMLEELFIQLFEKLKTEKDNNKKSKNGYFEYFVNIILNNDTYKIVGFSISQKAVKNYYEKYVEKKVNKSGEPKSELKDLIAQYLEFEDYTQFENYNKRITENNPEQLKEVIDLKMQIGFKEKYKNHIIVTSIISIFVIFLVLNKYNTTDSDTCIIWKETHFEKSACTIKNAIANSVYNIDIVNFKKIEVTKETMFFKKGNPQIWYGKSSNKKMEYFTRRGIHPETLKELDPITEYIINKYVFTEKSDKTIL